MSVVAHVTNDRVTVNHKLARNINRISQKLLSPNRTVNSNQSGVSRSQRTANKKKREWIKSWVDQSSKGVSSSQDSIIIVSPEKIQPVANTGSTHYSDAESDCEIIEQETPIIEIDIDDDCADEPIELNTQNETITTEQVVVEAACTSDPSNETTTISNTQHNTSIDSNAPTEEEISCKITTEPNSRSPEPDALFFVDKNPTTHFEAPIYEIISGPSTHSNQNMPQNFRITVPNKENNANLENSFAPNPLLSSTRLNISCHDVEESTGSSSNNDSTQQQPTNFQISVNSNSERRVDIGKLSPIVSNAKASNVKDNGNGDGKNYNTKDNNNKANNNIAPKAIKRKAENNAREEPLSKRSHSELSDVIVLNDTAADEEEDSVVFVSETIDHQNRNRIALARGNAVRGRAADFISLRNVNENKNSPKSTRAKRKQERKKLEKERGKQGKGVTKQQKKNNSKNGKMSRFGVKEQITPFDRSALLAVQLPTPASATVTSARATKKNVSIEYEKEKKLFAEKPELFEKRLIVIDGSNVAYAHGLKDKSFSVKGIELCIKYFESKGFDVRVVVPQMRKKRNMSTDPDALERLENAGKIVFTPCKNLPGQRSSSYDDRMIIELAEHKNAAIISNDNYADLLQKSAEWDEIIKERVIGFTFCDDLLMIPEDPYGKNGRTLQLILHKLKDDAQIEESTSTK